MSYNFKDFDADFPDDAACLEFIFKQVPNRKCEYGTVWHVDHIVPSAKFNLMEPQQRKAAFHFSNLRPEYPIQNMIKSDKIVTCQPELILQLA